MSTSKLEPATIDHAKLESLRRMKAAREQRKQSKAAVVLQALVRGALQRLKYRKALANQKEVGGLQEKIDFLRAKLSTADAERARAVKEAEERVTKAMASSMEDDDLDDGDARTVSQKAKLDESEKVLDFLRQERKRLMDQARTVKTRCDRVAENNKQIEEHTEHCKAKSEELQQYMVVLQENKATLTRNQEVYANQLKAYRKELKRGMVALQTEEDIRAAYRNTVENIVALAQNECKDDDLVDDIYLMALECGELDEDKFNNHSYSEEDLTETEISIEADFE
jgi:chromosome segregation ATPase